MKTLVAGIGSIILGDDGVGVHAARQLKARGLGPEIDVAELGTAGLGLLDIAQGYERLILLDAMVSGAPPGTVHQLSGDQLNRAVHLGPGHDADLSTAVALGQRLLGTYMPREVRVIAVEAAELNRFSERLTPEVAAAVPAVVDAVEHLVMRPLASNADPG